MPIIQLDFQNPLNASVQLGDVAYFANATPLGVGTHTHDPLNPQLSAPPHETAVRENIIKIGKIIEIKDFDGTTSHIRCDMEQVLFNKYGGDIAVGGCVTSIIPYTGSKTLMDPMYYVDSGPPPPVDACGDATGAVALGASTTCTNANYVGDTQPGQGLHRSIINNTQWSFPQCAGGMIDTLGIPPTSTTVPGPGNNLTCTKEFWDVNTTLKLDCLSTGLYNPPLSWFFKPGNENLPFDNYVFINYASTTNGMVYDPQLWGISYYTPGTTPQWSALYQSGAYVNSKFYTQHELIQAAIDDYTMGGAWVGGGFCPASSAPYHGMTWEEWLTWCPMSIGIPHVYAPPIWGHSQHKGSISQVNCNPGSFIMFSKDNKVNQQDTLGYYALVEFRNNDFYNPSELFNAGVTYFNSSK